MSAIHYSDQVKKMLTKVPRLRFSRRRCTCLGLISLLIFSIYLMLLVFWLSWPNLEVDKCPACYGVNRCPEMDREQVVSNGEYIDLRGESFFHIISILLSAKNVYYDKKGQYIAKKLAHNWELKKFDAKVCEMLHLEEGCDFSGLNNVPDLKGKIAELVELKPDSGANGMTLCPTTEGLDEILKPFITDKHNDTKRGVTMANVWTIMSINPEPIILQYFNSNGKWPVSQYEGACGRFTLQRNSGIMLSSLLGRSWLWRAQYAIALLQAADDFTFQHSRFRFYLTDISCDNIVVWWSSKTRVAFIDLENVIVLDKHTNKPPVSWDKVHASEIIDCPGCFAFSAHEICTHQLSDHNHYSICKLLEDELLYSIPAFVLQASPQLHKLLRQCVSPARNSPDRFVAAKILREELIKILKTFDNMMYGFNV